MGPPSPILLMVPLSLLHPPPSPAVCLVATKTIHSLTVALDGLSESDHHAHLLSSSADHLGTLCCVQDGP